MPDEDLVKFFTSKIKSGFYGDIRIGDSEGTYLTIENGRVRTTLKQKSSGFGLRIMRSGVWASASSNETSRKSIASALESTYAVINSKIKSTVNFRMEPESNNVSMKPKWKQDTRSVDVSKKLDLAMQADGAAKGKNIVSTMTVYGDSVTHWLIGSNLGNLVSFYESHPRLLVAAFVKDGSSVQSVKRSLGGNGGFENLSADKVIALGKTASEEAHNLIGAKPARGGKYDVVLDPSMTGVYTHEAFGHATEADGVLAGASVLEGRLDKRVGSEMVTIVDYPTIAGARGSFDFDQEGTHSKRRTLVEKGVLKEYLHTLETANRLNLTPNGAARAMDYASKPIARMSNTFIAPGDFTDDLCEGIKNGIAFYGFQYGYVNPGDGKFMFKSQYGRMIRNGKLCEYVRDAALTGSTLEVLNRLDAVGSDFVLDGGTCGKGGQWVPESSGGPSVRIRQVVVGGQ